MSGRITIAGLGPGSEEMVTPQVASAIAEASDIIGYIPYVARISEREGLRLHPSDNRVETERASHAFELAAGGAKVVIVSSGDPGVFAMAAAVFEVMEHASAPHRAIEVEVLPGITAMLAAAAACGAPLGHDFCCINLSDNLKPFSVIEKRVQLACEADFAMAFYNPRSKSRPQGFASVLELLKSSCEPERLMIFARAVSTADQQIKIVTLKDTTADMADMRTVVLVGSSQTRRFSTPHQDYVFTPRSLPRP